MEIGEAVAWLALVLIQAVVIAVVIATGDRAPRTATTEFDQRQSEAQTQPLAPDGR